MKKSKPKPWPEGHKCVVQGCANHKGEGEFVGVFCRPCYDFAVAGRGRFSQAYRNALEAFSKHMGAVLTEIIVKRGDPTETMSLRPPGITDEELANLRKG